MAGKLGFGLRRIAQGGAAGSGAPVTFEEMTFASITVLEDSKLVDLQGTIQANPALGSIEIIAAKEHLDYRFTDKTWDDAWLAHLLTVTSVEKGISGSGTKLYHSEGYTPDVLASEIDDCISDLETKIPGLTVKSWAYPGHRHDRYTMEMLRDRGITHARDGAMQPFPTGAAMMGTDDTQTKIVRSWECWCPWESMLQDGFLVGDLHGKTKTQMTDWLYDTAQYIIDESVPEGDQPELYGYSSLMAAWKAHNTWAPLYFHNTTELTAAEFEDIIEILQADSDIWLETAGTIAEYAHARHAANGTVFDDDLIYEPDADYGATPWNGHKMAVTVSLDDPQTSAVDTLTPLAVSMDCPLTMYVCNSNIEENGGGVVSVAELRSFFADGVEIGGHTYTHYHQFENLACKIKDTLKADCQRGIKIVSAAPNLNLKFYRDASIDLPIALGARLRKWWDAPSLGLANDAAVTSWTDRAGDDEAANASSIALYKTAYQNSLGAVYFDGGVPLVASTDNLHDPTKGMMIFLACNWRTSGWRRIFGKYKHVTDGHYFYFGPASSKFCADNDSSTGTVSWTNYNTDWPAFTWGIVAITWTPGAPVKIHLNGVLKQTGSFNLSGMEMDTGGIAPITIGADGDEASPYIGGLGDIIVVDWDDATLQGEIESWLMSSDRWNVT